MAGQVAAPAGSARAGFRGASILEVSLVFVVFSALARVRQALTVSTLSPAAQMYISGAMLFLIPIGIIWITRRDWATYGFTLRNWRDNLDVGMMAYLLRMITGAGIALLLYFGMSYRSLPGGLIMLALSLAQIILLGGMLRRRKETAQRALPNLLLLAGLLLLPVVVGLATGRLTAAVISTLVWQFVFSGFGEETYYRGYMQSRVNVEFGTPWRLFGIAVGPGLVVAAFLFGLAHVINSYNPLVGDYRLWWGWGLWTFAGGIFFGMIREKCGSILAPGLAHGVLDAVAESFAVLFGWSM